MSRRPMPLADANPWPRPVLTRHGAPQPVPVEALTSDDPDLHFVTADQRAWEEAHPCECEGLCECDRKPGKN